LGKVCHSGECSSPDTDTDTDTDVDTDTDTDSDTDSDTDTDTDSDTDTDTDTEPGENGDPCDDPAECASAYCNNGFCCDSGECCGDAGDCSDTTCDLAACDDGHQCAYIAYPCGYVDDDTGGTCTGDNLCDGEGNCITTTECLDAYSSSGEYVCTLNEVEELCFTECANEDQCNPGYDCVVTECLAGPEGDPNGSACVNGTTCASGYCGDGFCCSEGECCSVADDCDQSLCVQGFCDGNNICQYYDFEPCGVEDNTSTETCIGDYRCDGAGNCVAVDLCDGAYASMGDYSVCDEGAIVEACYTGCTSEAHCNENYYCDAGVCTVQIENGDGDCEDNWECVSGHCDATTGICCESGWCCNSSTQCSGYLCDTATWSCSFSCDDGSGDNDLLCAAAGGNYHCDDGSCWLDEFNGQLCNEASDCLSGYCDTAVNYVCCDGGVCCADDSDCGAYACNVDFQCETACGTGIAEDDTRCAEDYHCESNVCVEDLENGTGICDELSDCESGFCSFETELCCAGSGTDVCCASTTDCADDEGCTIDNCAYNYVCVYVDAEDETPCPDEYFCNGYETCYLGSCEAAVADGCSELENGCRDVSCNETEDSCPWVPANEGNECSAEEQFCTGDYLYCQSGGCMNLSGVTNTCADLDGDPCTEPVCNETDDVCEAEQVVGDGTDCSNGEPCDGLEGCLDGDCVTVPGSIPCETGQYCTEQECTVVDEIVTCGASTPIGDGLSCVGSNVACLGDANCLAGACIPDQTRPCSDGDICTQEVCNVVGGFPSCTTGVTGMTTSLTCGATAMVGNFSREYYSASYAGSVCSGEDVSGIEAGLVLTLGSAANVSLQVTDAGPGMVTTLLAVTDLCDPSGSSCYAVQDGGGILTITGMSAGTHYFILETADDLGVGGLYMAQVSVTCL
jgi:hypothetical protein